MATEALTNETLDAVASDGLADVLFCHDDAQSGVRAVVAGSQDQNVSARNLELGMTEYGLEIPGIQQPVGFGKAAVCHGPVTSVAAIQ